MWICLFTGRWFENTFEYTQWYHHPRSTAIDWRMSTYSLEVDRYHRPGWIQIFNGLYDWRCWWCWPWRCYRFISGSIVLIQQWFNDSKAWIPTFIFKSFNVNSISKKFESLLKKPWSWAVPSSSPEDLDEPVVERELMGENVIEQGIFKWYESINVRTWEAEPAEYNIIMR